MATVNSNNEQTTTTLQFFAFFVNISHFAAPCQPLYGMITNTIVRFIEQDMRQVLARDFSATLDKLNVLKAVIHKIEGVGTTRCIPTRANNERADLIKSKYIFRIAVKQL